MAVLARAIVEHPDVIGDVRSGQVTRPADLFADALVPQATLAAASMCGTAG